MNDGIIYFLIIVAVIIFNIVRGVKKAQQKQVDTPATDHPMPSAPKTWQDILRELQEASQPSPKQEEVIVVQEEPKRTEYQPIKMDYRSQEEIIDEETMIETKPVVKQSTTTKPKTPIEETEIKDAEYSIHSPEELQRAIIYSEILARKYS